MSGKSRVCRPDDCKLDCGWRELQLLAVLVAVRIRGSLCIRCRWPIVLSSCVRLTTGMRR